MANMSYCRFQNTLADLKDCYETLQDLFEGRVDRDGTIPAPLSRDELEAAKELVVCCEDILALYEGEAPDEYEAILDAKNEQVTHS